MKIDTVVSHCGWSEERKRSLERLMLQIPGTPLLCVSYERQHANVWARNMWELMATCDSYDEVRPDAWLVLNDDVELHPDIYTHVQSLVTLMPEDVISLHPQFDAVGAAARYGARLTRCYWPSGPAMVFPRGFASLLLNWLKTIPSQWFGGPVNEDGAIASFLWREQRPAYCSIPALVRHDTSIPSTLGYDSHPGRKSPVDWDLYPPGGWTSEDVEKAPVIPVPWMTHERLRQLGDALRGLVPLCGFCYEHPSTVVNRTRDTGVCFRCAIDIRKQTMLPPFAGVT